MTPAQVAHIMALLDQYVRACKGVTNYENVMAAKAVRDKLEAALRDAPQAEPVAWHVNFRGSSHLLTSLESVDLTDCIVTPLYPEPRAPDNTLKDRLLAALERAAGAESALRRLADKTEPLTQTRGYHALVQVIYELQQDGNYSDEEGEETSALVELLRAIEATPSAPTAVEPPYPMASTLEGAAQDVAKWLNERPNSPLDLRHVAMLVHAVQTLPTAVEPDERAELKAALIALLKHFPTDIDMMEAGWTTADIEAACNAYDLAKTKLGRASKGAP